jgi:hypothetical protein
MVAGFILTASGDSTRALGAGSQSAHMPQNLITGEKGGKATTGLHPDPRKVIPLDGKDQSILETV